MTANKLSAVDMPPGITVKNADHVERSPPIVRAVTAKPASSAPCAEIIFRFLVKKSIS